MRVLLVNTSERKGGPSIAAHRLMEALRKSGVKAKMLVCDKQSTEQPVVALEHSFLVALKALWELFTIFRSCGFRREHLFDVAVANAGVDITQLPEFVQADIIHLHWVNQGYLSIKSLQKIFESGKPVVWTMHNMWPCTGICFYARGCRLYETACHDCHYLLHGAGKRDCSQRVFEKKQKLYNRADITFVTCSEWLKDEARKSALLRNQRIVSIPNPINVSVFRTMDRVKARRLMRLPEDKKLLLFGSGKRHDPRKGMEYFVEGVEQLLKQHPEVRNKYAVVVLGEKVDHNNRVRYGLPVYEVEYIHSEQEMMQLYNAVDLFVLPTLEDNLPNTVMESMACGTPCVAFDVGGIPEMVDHLHNGYVARYRDTSDLANGIYWAMQTENYGTLSEMAVRKVTERYSEEAISRQYIKIYNQITGKENA